MNKFKLKRWASLNAEPFILSPNDKCVIVFSYSKEIEKDWKRLEYIKDSVKEIKEALNEWSRSSDDQFFALITPEDVEIAFEKVSVNDQSTAKQDRK
jgi:hypothetical protein